MTVASYRPKLFALSNPKEREAWRAFSREQDAPLDASRLAGQWGEWWRCAHPELRQAETDDILDAAFEARQRATETGRYGTVAWYPWRNEALLLLEEKEFIQVRTNRNQLKIRPEEQQELAGKSVGIVGLSVGRSMAIALAMERIVGRLHLADSDTIELSNLNRMPCSLFELGTAKLVSAARAIAEVDPFLKVHVWPEGFQAENMGGFMDDLDLVVDACDGLQAKALLRLGARDRRIPLIMETNDRGLIDIERYDLEETEDFLHGRVTAEQLSELAGGGGNWTPDWLDAFVDIEQVSFRGRESLSEVGKSLAGWPQLHSEVALGAGAAAATIRRLLLGEPIEDQRIRFDLNEQLSVANTA
jgi:hypothetical protein